jgi:hypothetical protein
MMREYGYGRGSAYVHFRFAPKTTFSQKYLKSGGGWLFWRASKPSALVVERSEVDASHLGAERRIG